MRTIKIIILILFLHIAFQTTGQTKDSLSVTQRFARDNKFFHFFLFRDSTSQNYLFTLALKYQITAHTNSFSSNGAYAHIGLNLARFFSKKIILGVFYELKPLHGPFYPQPASSQFKTDFNNNFNTTYNSQEDSAVAYTLRRALIGGYMSSGNFGSYGIMVSLFPNKFGGILLSLKRSGSGYRVGGVYGDSLIENGTAENLYFNADKNYGLELSFKPYAFFKNSYINFEQRTSQKFLKAITCSIYYERFNLKDADFGGVKFTDMVTKGFISKYGATNRFGFTIGWSLY